MSSPHPDADAFIRRILANPEDALPRLVFADWLDETGDPGNAAWAEYIRLRTVAEFDESALIRSLALDRANDPTRRVVARLTMPASQFVPVFPSLLKLLPPARFTVLLDGYTVIRPIFGTLWPGTARQLNGLPLAVARGITLVGVANPENREVIAEFEHFFRPMVVVQVPEDQVGPAVSRTFPPIQNRIEVTAEVIASTARPLLRQSAASNAPQPRHETVADLLTGWSDRSNPLEVLKRIVEEARLGEATAVEVYPDECAYVVRYTVHGELVPQYSIAANTGRRLVQAAAILPRRRLKLQVIRREMPHGLAAKVILLVRAGKRP